MAAAETKAKAAVIIITEHRIIPHGDSCLYWYSLESHRYAGRNLLLLSETNAQKARLTRIISEAS